jgi:hypothetical protein
MKQINEEIAEKLCEELVKKNIMTEYDRSNFISAISGHLGNFSGRYRMLNKYGSRFDFIIAGDQVEIVSYCNSDVSELNIELNRVVR